MLQKANVLEAEFEWTFVAKDGVNVFGNPISRKYLKSNFRKNKIGEVL